MSWTRAGQRVLVWHEDGEPTPRRILKIGLAEPYRYECWNWPHLLGICDNVEDAKQLKEAHVRADVAVSSEL